MDRGRLRNFEDFADLSLDELLGKGERLRFSLNLFGDASGRVDAEPAQGQRFAFAVGQLGLLASAEVGSSTLAVAEVVFEANQANAYAVDVERLSLQWSRSWFQVTAGRIHTPIGYWNTAFHHGSWMQLTIDRPKLFAFEDEQGILPVHSVGVFAAIRTPISDGRFQLEAGVANGRGHSPNDVRVINDTNNAKSFLVSAYEEGLLVSNLRVGAAFLYDRIAGAPEPLRPALPNTPIDELIGSAHVVYEGPRLTVVWEGIGLVHRAQDREWALLGSYLLVGVRIGQLTPFVRGELSLPSGGIDPFFTPDPSAPDADPPARSVSFTAGLRYNLASWCALKLEYQALSLLDPGQLAHTATLNWSFGI